MATLPFVQSSFKLSRKCPQNVWPPLQLPLEYLGQFLDSDGYKDTPTSFRIILKIRYQKNKPNCVMKASSSTPTQTVIMRGNGMPHNISEPITWCFHQAIWFGFLITDSGENLWCPWQFKQVHFCIIRNNFSNWFETNSFCTLFKLSRKCLGNVWRPLLLVAEYLWPPCCHLYKQKQKTSSLNFFCNIYLFKNQKCQKRIIKNQKGISCWTCSALSIGGLLFGPVEKSAQVGNNNTQKHTHTK